MMPAGRQGLVRKAVLFLQGGFFIGKIFKRSSSIQCLNIIYLLTGTATYQQGLPF
jgi:hypothetical protein